MARKKAKRPKKKPFKPQIYKIEEVNPAQRDLEAYDGDGHEKTNEAIDWHRAVIKLRDKKRA